MSLVAASATIRRPIAEVFAALTNVELTGRWFPGDVEEHWTTLPPHGVGSTRHAIVRMLGRRSDNDAVVTAFDPPVLASLRGTTPGQRFEATLTFRELDGATRVDVVAELQASGPMRLVMPLFARWYEGQWRRGLAAATRMLESGEL